jgi:hypothetical protein
MASIEEPDRPAPLIPMVCMIERAEEIGSGPTRTEAQLLCCMIGFSHIRINVHVVGSMPENPPTLCSESEGLQRHLHRFAPNPRILNELRTDLVAKFPANNINETCGEWLPYLRILPENSVITNVYEIGRAHV